MDAIGNANRQLPIGILLPLAFSKERLNEAMGDLNYFGLARLKTGTSVAVANEGLNALQHAIFLNLPADEKATLSSAITPFQEKLVGNNQKPLMILLVAVAGLLLVGVCQCDESFAFARRRPEAANGGSSRIRYGPG